MSTLVTVRYSESGFDDDDVDDDDFDEDDGDDVDDDGDDFPMMLAIMMITML